MTLRQVLVLVIFQSLVMVAMVAFDRAHREQSIRPTVIVEAPAPRCICPEITTTITEPAR